jgi:hypothetical protein
LVIRDPGGGEDRFYKYRFCVWTDAINLVEMANVIIAEIRDT